MLMLSVVLDIESTDEFKGFLCTIIHQWLKTLTLLGFTLVPIFFLLDYVMVYESSRDLLYKFGSYRAISSLIVIIQYIMILKTRPSRYSFLHAYFFTINVGLVIVLMTKDMGGFNSSYYAGLNLIIIAVNMLIPWSSIHSLFNGLIIIGLYVIINFVGGDAFLYKTMLNNLFFLGATIIIAVGITYVKHELIKKEFEARKELKVARDMLWGEMELAKKIQYALLPSDSVKLKGYEFTATMLPAEEVGGDYYDIIKKGHRQFAVIGDVSGHGLNSGLVMMMAETILHTIINLDKEMSTPEILIELNKTLAENIGKLKESKYMTMTLFRLEPDGQLKYAGAHLHSIVYRRASKALEILESNGSWLGMHDDISVFTTERESLLNKGDILFLYTDGVTDAIFKDSKRFGLKKLEQMILENADQGLIHLKSSILASLKEYHAPDDITMLIIEKT